MSTRVLCLYFSVLLLNGCHYRFSNSSLKPPVGVKSIAVESIYDSTRIVLPHEILWEHIQRELAADGRLILTSKRQADAYLRVHLREATSKQVDVEGGIETEFGDIYDSSQNSFRSPFVFPSVRGANKFAKQQTLSFFVDVEVWNLKTKEKIMTRSYPVSGSYKILDNVSFEESLFLKREEGFRSLFSALSKGAAKSVVRDLLSL